MGCWCLLWLRLIHVGEACAALLGLEMRHTDD